LIRFEENTRVQPAIADAVLSERFRCGMFVSALPASNVTACGSRYW
jgi:hypothetical protein